MEKISTSPTTKPEGAAQQARLTRIRSMKPSILSKQYALAPDGKLQKKTSANMIKGMAIPVTISGFDDFTALLLDLGQNEALDYGIVAEKQIGLVSREEWLALGRPDDPQPRTKEAFRWTDGPGVLVLDYDPNANEKVQTREELIGAIREAVPGLANAGMLWWPSSSSHICNGNDDLTGLKGQRIYILVLDARDIPRAGKALAAHLRAAGHCQIMISKSGQMLGRTLVDTSVWQTNRLDFAAGAACEPPLEQRRGNPVKIEGQDFIDSIEAIPSPSREIKARGDSNMTKARSVASEEAFTVRKMWEKARGKHILRQFLARGGEDNDDNRKIIDATVRRAVEHRVLCGEFDITVIEQGKQHSVTVGAILDDPFRYHGLQTLDPLEPDYDGGRPVGKLYLIGSRSNLYSLAHGGTNYRLERQPAKIELVRGKTHDATMQTLALLRLQPDIFDFGDSLVLVEAGNVFSLEEFHLRHYLGGIVQFWAWKRTPNGQMYASDEDPPAAICKNILALTSRRNLKKLEAVITAPTIKPDGTILASPDYDEQTGLLLDSDEPVNVPMTPSREQVQTAIARLMRPFNDFPFATPRDKGVLLAGLLTSVIRPSLPTAPAIGLDAPVQGSGKTLLAGSIAALGTGEVPSIWPHTSDKSDEEIRKRIFTALRSGSRAIVWDNLIGVFQSAAMAAALTWPTYQDRVLGKSEAPKVPNKAIFLLTGNNICLAGDMPRRVLICRIDPKSERPFARQFDIDPLAYVLSHRIEMVEAALTIIRGWLTSGDDRATGRMASFELWDDLVRQPVAWINRKICPNEYCDPMDAVLDSQRTDPEQETLLELLVAWKDVFGDLSVTSRMVLDRVSNDYSSTQAQRLKDAIVDICNAMPNVRGLGRLLSFRKDRVVGSRRLEQCGEKDGSQLWRVKVV